MEDYVQLIEINPGLDDSNLERYEYSASDNILKIYVRTWNNMLIEFSFSDILHFTDTGCDELKFFCRVTDEQVLLKSVLKSKFFEMPLENDYNHFRFYDENQYPCLEIICEKFEYIKRDKKD